MTPHEAAVEAAARAILMLGWVCPIGMTPDELFNERRKRVPVDWQIAVASAEAAIASFEATMAEEGWVMVRDVGERPVGTKTTYLGCIDEGWNAARAAMIAARPRGTEG